MLNLARGSPTISRSDLVDERRRNSGLIHVRTCFFLALALHGVPLASCDAREERGDLVRATGRLDALRFLWMDRGSLGADWQDGGVVAATLADVYLAQASRCENCPLVLLRWNGVAWETVRTDHAPPGRRDHAVAARGSSLVLFGGRAGDDPASDLGDTWVWNEGDWQQLSPAASPPPRHGHAMAAVGDEVLLFGGSQNQPDGSALNLEDTWRWDGENWTEIPTARRPPARHGHAMAFAGGRVLLFGGDTAPESELSPVFTNDLWEWTGSDWQPLPVGPPRPAARSGHGMAVQEGEAFVVSGFGDAFDLDDTWRFDGTSWWQVAARKYPPRGAVSMATDPRTGRYLVLQGGPQTAMGFFDNVTCTAGSDCFLGHCVDGYCCDSDCGGGAAGDCVTCADPRDPGVCLIRGREPCRPAADRCDVAETCDGVSPDCPPDLFREDGLACQEDGDPCTVDQCNAAGRCLHFPGNAGTVCQEAECADGIARLRSVCDGVRAGCPAPVRIECSPFLCRENTCAYPCRSNLDCREGYTCWLAQCVQPLPPSCGCASGPISADGWLLLTLAAFGTLRSLRRRRPGTRRMLTAALVAALASAPAFARADADPDRWPLLKPLSLQDLTLTSELDFFMPMVVGREARVFFRDTYLSLAPTLSVEFGWGDSSVGVTLPAAVLQWWETVATAAGPAKLDESYRSFGNPCLSFRHRKCSIFHGAACYGFTAEAAFGLAAVDRLYSVSDPYTYFMETDVVDLAASIGHQGMIFNIPEHAAIRAMAVFAGSSQGMYYQIEAGLSLLFPVRNVKFWRDAWRESVQTALSFGLGIGWALIPYFIPVIELRAEVPVSDFFLLGNENLYWLNLGCRFVFGRLSPSLKLSIPLKDTAKFFWDSDWEIQGAVGVSWEI